MSKIVHVLLTGGVGSRLWPLSRQSKPKQYLEIFSGSSLFELAVKRNAAHCNDLIVVGSKGNKHLCENILARLEVSPFIHISEAVSRNTAPAIAFAALCTDPEDLLLVTPADHIIEEGEAYEKALEKAIDLSRQDFLVTFGVQPDRPETGYGYIEYNNEDVISFREKPTKENAEAFIKSKSFLWNSGMFCFKAGLYLEELEKHQPELYRKALEAWNLSINGTLDYNSSQQIPSLSVDYAIMEHSKRIKVVPATFKWSDMGSFEAVYDFLKSNGHSLDLNENMQIGETKPTFFVGLKNCILISTKDANLIVAKEASQDVKQIYAYLETTHPELLQ